MCQADVEDKGAAVSQPEEAALQTGDSGDAKEPVTYTLAGITCELDGGRSVFVGQQEGNSNVFIRFWNGEMETKIQLSFDAAILLRDLLGSISRRGLMAESTWMVMSEKAANSRHPDEEPALAGDTADQRSTPDE